MQQPEKILFSAAGIQAAVRRLAAEISREYAGADEPVLAVGLLKGAFVFMADLVRALTVAVEVEFMAVESYGTATETSGKVRLRLAPGTEMGGRHVLIVEDIVDTGLTLEAVLDQVRSAHPASVRTVALLDKPARRRVAIHPDHVGFTVPDVFVCGYGLDAAGRYRQLPYIAILES